MRCDFSEVGGGSMVQHSFSVQWKKEWKSHLLYKKKKIRGFNYTEKSKHFQTILNKNEQNHPCHIQRVAHSVISMLYVRSPQTWAQTDAVQNPQQSGERNYESYYGKVGRASAFWSRPMSATPASQTHLYSNMDVRHWWVTKQRHQGVINNQERVLCHSRKRTGVKRGQWSLLLLWINASNLMFHTKKVRNFGCSANGVWMAIKRRRKWRF